MPFEGLCKSCLILILMDYVGIAQLQTQHFGENTAFNHSSNWRGHHHHWRMTICGTFVDRSCSTAREATIRWLVPRCLNWFMAHWLVGRKKEKLASSIQTSTSRRVTNVCTKTWVSCFICTKTWVSCFICTETWVSSFFILVSFSDVGRGKREEK